MSYQYPAYGYPPPSPNSASPHSPYPAPSQAGPPQPFPPPSPSTPHHSQFPIAQPIAPTPIAANALSPTWGAPPPIPPRPASSGPSAPSTSSPPENATWPAYAPPQASPRRALTPRPSVEITSPTPPPRLTQSKASHPPPLPPRSPRVGQGSYPPYSHATHATHAPHATPSQQQDATFQSTPLQQDVFVPAAYTPHAQHTAAFPSPSPTTHPRPIPLLPEHTEPHTSPPQATRPLASSPRHGSTSSHPMPTPQLPPRHTSSTSPTRPTHASPPLTQSQWPNGPAAPLSPASGTSAGSSSGFGAGPSRPGPSQSPSRPGPSSSNSPPAAPPATRREAATAGSSSAAASSPSPTSPRFSPHATSSGSGPRVVPLVSDYKQAFLGEEMTPQTQPLPSLPAPQDAQSSADRLRSSTASPRLADGETPVAQRQGRLSRPSLAVPSASSPRPSSPMPSDPLEGLISDVDDMNLEPPPTYVAAMSHPAAPPAAVSQASGSQPLPPTPASPPMASPPIASPALSASPTSPDAATLMSLVPGMGTFAGISTLFHAQPEPQRPFELVIDRPVPIPTVRLDDPADIVYRCPGLDQVRPFPLTWYHLRGGHEDFLMCSKCHQDFVADTPYAKDFVELQEHCDGMCSYAIPKAAYKLLPEAKRTRDGTALKAWIQEREAKRHCMPGETLTPADNVKWFAPKEHAINDFVMCAECMDDIVSVTPFTDKFEACEMPAGESWNCDGAQEALRNNLLRAGSIGPAAWGCFCADVNRLQTQPLCDGKSVESTSRKWYTTSRPIHGFVCCERCYLEIIKASPFASDFVPYDQPPAPNLFWSCDFSSPRMRYAFEVAVDHGSFDIWWMAMDTVVRKMLDRDARPDLDLDMWGLANVPAFKSWGEGCNSDFSLCGECYPAFVTPLRLEKFFRPRARRTGHKCSFCDQPSTAVRFPVYLTKLAQALDWGLWTPFYETAFWLGFAPPCPRRELVDPTGRRWWGWRPNLQICEECYWTFARDTWAEPHFDFQGVVTGDSKNICTLYSPLMRGKYLDACERQDVAQLLAFAEERGHAYRGLQKVFVPLRTDALGPPRLER